MFSTMPSTCFAHLLKHVHGFARIFERYIGRRRYDDGAGQRRGLNQRELDVAGARRQIDDQIIELAPIDIAKELLNDAVEHGAAPHERLIARIEEAHGHQTHAMRFKRLNALADRVRSLAGCPS